MTTEALKTALDAAKDLHDHGKFGTLEQAEFFKAMEAGLADPDPPPPPPAPAPAPEATKVKEEAPKVKSTKS
jgi:hypothetical protein